MKNLGVTVRQQPGRFVNVEKVLLGGGGGGSGYVIPKIRDCFFDIVLHFYTQGAVVVESDVHAKKNMLFSSGDRHIPET